LAGTELIRLFPLKPLFMTDRKGVKDESRTGIGIQKGGGRSAEQRLLPGQTR